MNMTFMVVAGLLCLNGNNCVDVPYNTKVYITDDVELMTDKCWNPVSGCALINKREVWVMDAQGGWNHKYAILFHELLHHEFYARTPRETGHPEELIARDNALRRDFGILNCYLSDYTIKWNGINYVERRKGSCGG